MEFGDASDEEAPPPCPRNRDLSKNYANADCCNAPRDGKQQLLETRFGDHHHQKVQHGMLHSSPLMEAGSAHACHRHT